ncbi:uracil-DNA glycosylase [Novosphingobium sp. YJ-S2-02]|uniref:Uracil-DNA glycosylase n=1 Tax=Novosphingobium aureum TaxID=2792964 RepID=A0A931H9N0_9SPHN|nr:uracil-DNA glycosylase [Novosphingobium aureum]MBH0111558.1 uracil-DNA glycosylase [Novosphingobium aureum]
MAATGGEAGAATALRVPAPWREALSSVLASPGLADLAERLAREEAAGSTVFPPPGKRMRALELTSPESVRVVILGQDPYHGAGQAHGLAFSVPHGIKVPPSLVNIYKELASDLGIVRPDHGNLEHWARQGVLLLNNALTVAEGQAGSHRTYGWEPFTDAVVAAVAASAQPVVFMLWGSHAQAKAARIDDLARGPHLVLESPHPSPLSARRGFFGCRHFSRANEFLDLHGRGRIDW